MRDSFEVNSIAHRGIGPRARSAPGEEKFPVYNVNWFEATEYCKSVGNAFLRKPNGRKQRGVDLNAIVILGRRRRRYDPRRGPVQEASLRTTNAQVPAVLGRNNATKVGSLRPNGYGLDDIIGNVQEWLNDRATLMICST